MVQRIRLWENERKHLIIMVLTQFSTPVHDVMQWKKKTLYFLKATTKVR